jgi:hypothetical protein
MIEFKAIIRRFHQHGEKSGWTYIEIPVEVSDQINPGVKTAFRVKGKLNSYSYEWISTIPMGEGQFIIAINAEMRKGIRKQIGESLTVLMTLDNQEKPLSETFITCLEDEPAALDYFKSLPKGHQRYFSNWIESAKTDTTKTKRIAQAVNALAIKLGFSEMVRMNR